MHGNKGKKFTKAHRLKLRFAKLGKKRGHFSFEHKMKISKSHIGIRHTKEVLKRISQKLKGRKAWNKGKKCFWRGNKHWNWKGGKHFNSQGYIIIYKPKHPFCDNNGYIREQRFIMEQKIKRYLNPHEIVHHINRIKTDNRIVNLKLFKNRNAHNKFHKIINSL